MDNLIVIIEIITYLLCLAWLWGFVVAVFNKIVKKEPILVKNLILSIDSFTKKPLQSSLIALAVLAVFLFNNSTFNELVGREKSLSRRTSGSYCYYVDVIEEATGKKYTVPAKISAYPWTDEDSSGKTYGGVDYYVDQLVFDDGRVVEMDGSYDASFQNYNSCYDTKGNEWRCRLTDNHAYSNLIQETSFVSVRSVVELCVVVSIILFNFLGGLAFAIKETSP